jgi:tol-pal system protein YbgF
MILDLTAFRYLLLLTIILTGCAVQVPREPVTETGQADVELQQLRQDQLTLASKVTSLEAQVRRLEVRLQALQASTSWQSVHPTEMVTGNGQKAEPGATLPGPGQIATSSATATDIYLKAFSDYASGRFSEAITGFRQFLERYPDNDFSGNAQFWLGECYYSQRLLSRALTEFSLVAERYPDASKAPDALLRMAGIYDELNQPENRRRTEDLLLQLYPQSDAGNKLRSSRSN